MVEEKYLSGGYETLNDCCSLLRGGAQKYITPKPISQLNKCQFKKKFRKKVQKRTIRRYVLC
jgi:hypothetical protein